MMKNRHPGNKGTRDRAHNGSRAMFSGMGYALRIMIGSILCATCLWTQANSKPQTDAMQKADVAFRAGYAARAAGNLEEARARFAEVVRLAPQIPEGHQALGAILLELGKSDQAIPQLEAAARLKPNDQLTETNLAYAFAQAGQPAKAMPHFQAVLRLAQQPDQPPLDGPFRDAYARALAADGKRAEALEQFAAEEKITGPRADVEDSIGAVLAQMGRWDEARHAFEQALAIDSSYARAKVHLGAL